MSTETPLWQLMLFRFRALYREPSVLFWVFAFPLLASLALGIAFRSRGLDEMNVEVADGPDADSIAQTLDQVDGLRAERASLDEAKERLRVGRAALVVVPGTSIELVVDPTQPNGRAAKLMAVDALESSGGRQDVLAFRQREQTAPGSRYIDFLIPGLLGMSLMSSGIWGIGWSLVQMRTGKLLKRLIATPMSRGQFLFSFVISRLVLGVVEVAFFVLFARLFFDVRIFGNALSLLIISLLGTLSFGGLGLLVASRAQNTETASGLMNVATMPMMVLGGVFFSASNFPEFMQPVLKLIPLTALNDSLRAVMIDGSPLTSQLSPIAVLVGWGVVTFTVALKIFRWQ